MSGDIQTVALLSSQVSVLSHESLPVYNKLKEWIEHYRELLDRLELYMWRASYDVSCEYDPNIASPSPSVFARCANCNQSFALTMIRSSKERLQGSTVRHKENVSENFKKEFPFF